MVKRATLQGKGLDALIAHPKRSKPTVQTKSTWVHKTFLLTPKLLERLEQAVAREGVGKNEFVRYALDSFLNDLESGRHKLPVQIREVGS